MLSLCERHRTVTTVVSLLLASVVAFIDYATGDKIPLIVCYLPSIMVVCWISHAAIGTTLAMVCCTGWLVDDLIGLEEEALSVHEIWTAVIHLMFFLVIIGMLKRLRAGLEREERLARTDHLTGLLNSNAFRMTAQQEAERARKTGHPLAMAYLDCDRFKMVNDTLGHSEGDRLLQAIGETLRSQVRPNDIPARLGGDEFAILMPETSRSEAEAVIERIQRQWNDVRRVNDWPVTFSIGLAVSDGGTESVDEMIHRCDLLMYEMKRQRHDAVAYKRCV